MSENEAWDEALPDRKRLYSEGPFGNRLEFLRDGDGFTQRQRLEVNLKIR